MKLKKIPYQMLLLTLAIGASFIIGLLSFTGLYTLLPFVALATAAFGLSVIYEAEIYFQNIKGALNKLFFKPKYLEHELAKEYLLKHFPDTSAENCPKFFKDYQIELRSLHKFDHKNLDEASLARKQQIEKTLSDMEKLFAIQLFSNNDEEEGQLTPYEQELRAWLMNKENRAKQEEAENRLRELRKTFSALKIFSFISGAFMSLGMTYLLVEAFAVIPVLAAISLTALPFLIVPMAIISGAAYMLLIYNAATDMVLNDTIRKLWDKVTLKDGVNKRTIPIAILAVILVTLTIALTVCTAGTWWTIAKNSRPLFTWLGKMPRFIMGIIHPIITGFSQLFFNLENTNASMQMIEDATEVNIFKKIGRTIAKIAKHTIKHENWLQWINVPRLILKLTFVPLRILLFFGHLVSIGVTADRVPTIPELASAILGFICEGFEDAHYYLSDLLHKKHQHTVNGLLEERLARGHGHSHEADIPTKILQFFFLPLYYLAAAWDYAATRLVSTPNGALSWDEAKDKQYGLGKKEEILLEEGDKPSIELQVAHTVYCIDRYISKHLDNARFDVELAEQKTAGLKQLKSDLLEMENPTEQLIKNRISQEAAHKGLYNKQRFFEQEGKITRTQDFLDIRLSARTCASAA